MLKWSFFILWTNFIMAHKRSDETSYCLWYNNSCVDFCPEGLLEVESNCSQSYWYAQRTCDRPEPTLVGTVCGFSRCECPNLMLLDTETGYCYDADNCPMKHSEFN